MRFMVLVPADAQSESGALPDGEMLGKMGQFNEQMVKAGVMVAGEGLHPTSKGARIKFGASKTMVVDGPFTESKELIAGFWILQVKSKDEAIAWMQRAPFPQGVQLEIRQIFDPADFAPVDPTGEHRAREEQLRQTVASQKR